MLFDWIWIILINKYVTFFILTKKEITLGKDILNLLGWSKTRKTEIHSTHILPKSVYTDSYLTHPARTNRPITHSLTDEESKWGENNMKRSFAQFQSLDCKI